MPENPENPDDSTAFDWLESPIIGLEAGLNFKVTGIVPKDFSSAGMSLSIRALTRFNRFDDAVDGCLNLINRRIEKDLTAIAAQLGGVAPFPAQKVSETP